MRLVKSIDVSVSSVAGSSRWRRFFLRDTVAATTRRDERVIGSECRREEPLSGESVGEGAAGAAAEARRRTGARLPISWSFFLS